MRPQVVRPRLRDLQIDKRADRNRAGDEDETVDLRGMPPRAANGDRLPVAGFVFGFADGLDQHLEGLPNQSFAFA